MNPTTMTAILPLRSAASALARCAAGALRADVRAPAPRRAGARATQRRCHVAVAGSTAAGAAPSTSASFREQWMPLRGNILLGIGSTVFQDKRRATSTCASRRAPTASSTSRCRPGQKEAAFKLVVDRTTDDKDDDLHVRQSASTTSRSGSSIAAAREGWLYATIEGKYKGEDRQVIYPDAPHRLRDRRVHPQVAMADAAVAPRSRASSACSRRARTARCCASRSATST